ncbi:hemerythrin [Paramagnetospirillum marisnigri]|uniref:Hemerythrin n=1 Tax=Paramagnetospirillum marisnigri TaxID=1285242 RepID=A0A178MEZ2_9PROT|nr:bacteriohemerythrin [Paramagnetospirillum marisnigri]OAN46615.1 hemerythrin [Paramagnetospirillum marisnigri]
MAELGWNSAYDVGHPMLDSDHRVLISLLDQLFDAAETGQSRDVIENVLFVLAEYVEHHFEREEAIMAAAGFPQLEAHQREHRELAAKVNRIRDDYRHGNKRGLGDEVVDLLKKWLTGHILVSDNSYRPWVERALDGGPVPPVMEKRGLGAS